MKITPMAVWGQHLTNEDLFKAIVHDVSFMHSRHEMWNLCTAYCIVIKTLINETENENRA